MFVRFSRSFFLQEEAAIRVLTGTGVQTCALRTSGHAPPRLDRVVRARREAQPAARTRLVHDPHDGAFDRHRVGGTHPYAGHTGHARVGFDLKVHETAGRGAAALRKTSSKGAVTWTPEHCLSIGARTTTLWWSVI